MSPVLPPFLIVRWLLLLIILTALYFIKIFLMPSLAALIVGIASWPIYQRVLYVFSGKNALAASVSLLFFLLVLVIPITFAFAYAVQEASVFIKWAITVNRNGISIPFWISSMPILGDKLSDYWCLYFGEPYALGRTVQVISGEHLGNIYRMLISATSNFFHSLLSVFFMLITLFFVYKDGVNMLAQLDIFGNRILPDSWIRLSRVVPAMINSTVTGMTLIAMGEGVILGFAYWIAGVPSPVLLGCITCFLALIPGGAPFVFTMVSLYLLSSGKAFAALCLFIWGTFELFVVDKTIRPRLVGGPVKLPFLPTFFGLIGGLKTMGIIGLFIGPVLMAIVVAMWREWIFSAQNNVDSFDI
ncbi:PurR regulon permease [Candidatus Kinetoplastibacterium desouzaii TCC079E]|uniref:PurR regulon permease n=1 Tax=Candidatus Kinetoplastidibacterium desouzai TCC079E TaxID=1208919 RepID=M1L1J3_9PROT|nr:AI-2E family transporter [Candidatus Kinetoplastibacterium desouzaii]AGF46638.1 PurR regulon permease [Candidatus Kinetoplastibacterium desouzaii TCC079E]